MDDSDNEKDQPNPPIMMRMQRKDGMVIYPRMQKKPDGSWEIAHPEAIREFLQCGEKDTKE
jgi:hypothetical protein